MTEPLVTARLDLDAMRHEHVDILMPLFADQRIYEYLPHMQPATAEEMRDRVGRWLAGPPADKPERRAYLNWVGFVRKTRAPFGTLQATLLEDASASIGYIIFPAHQRCGYAVEAMQAVCDHLRERYGVKRILADMVRGNLGSARVAEKLGMFEIPAARADERAYAWERR